LPARGGLIFGSHNRPAAAVTRAQSHRLYIPIVGCALGQDCRRGGRFATGAERVHYESQYPNLRPTV